MKKIISILIIAAFCASFSYGEYIYLRSGEVLSGKIVSETNSTITVAPTAGGKNKVISFNDIADISKTRKDDVVGSNVSSNPQDALTQFTSTEKQTLENSKERVIDNTSGVLVFNVQKVTGTATTVSTTQSAPVPVSAPAPVVAAAPASNSNSDDLSQYLSDNVPSTPVTTAQAPAPVVAAAPVVTASVSAPKPNTNSDDLSQYLSDNVPSANTTVSAQPVAAAAPVSQSVSNPTVSANSNSDDFDAAAYLLGNDSGSSASVAAPAPAPVKATVQPAVNYNDDGTFDAAAYLLGLDSGSSTPAPAASAPAPAKTTAVAPSSKPAPAASASSATPASSGKTNAETFIAFAFDLQGTHKFKGTAVGDVDLVNHFAPASQKTDYSFSFAAERYGYLTDYLAIGAGIGYANLRHLEITPGMVGFIPAYASVKFRFINSRESTVYAVGQIGYDFLISNNKYLSLADSSGGLYYAGGLGFSLDNIVLQGLYSVYGGKISYTDNANGTFIDRTVTMSKIGIYIGYLFNF